MLGFEIEAQAIAHLKIDIDRNIFCLGVRTALETQRFHRNAAERAGKSAAVTLGQNTALKNAVGIERTGPPGRLDRELPIGRASCRAGVFKTVEISVGAVI